MDVYKKGLGQGKNDKVIDQQGEDFEVPLTSRMKNWNQEEIAALFVDIEQGCMQ